MCQGHFLGLNKKGHDAGTFWQEASSLLFVSMAACCLLLVAFFSSALTIVVKVWVDAVVVIRE